MEDIQILEKYLESDNVDELTQRAIKKLISHNLQKEEQDMIEVMEKLKDYEGKYNISSNSFLEKFHNGELGDEEDFFAWEALLKMKENINDRIGLLRGNFSNTK